MRLTPSVVIVLMTVLALLVDGVVSAPRRKHKHRGRRLSKMGKAIEVFSNTMAAVVAGYEIYEIFTDIDESEPEKTEPKPTNRRPIDNLNLYKTNHNSSSSSSPLPPSPSPPSPSPPSPSRPSPSPTSSTYYKLKTSTTQNKY